MSDLYTLDWRDVGKGVLLAVVASILVFLQGSLANGLTVDWAELLRVALASGLGYIMKNYLTDKDNKLLGKY